VIARVVNLGQQLMSPKLRLPPVARRLSQRAREVLRRSSSEASCFSATVTTEYVLLAALSLERAPVAKFLRNHGLGPRLLCSIGPRLNSSYCSDLVQLDKETNAAILRADGIARQLSTELISAAALLLGILQVENSRASIALNQVGIDSKSLFDELMQWTKARKSRTVQGQK
jgi:ATP-dependent Clp protease ATP-binding subunit ClpA